MKQALVQLESKLKVARTPAEISTIVQDYLATHHITTFSFTYYSYYPNSLNKLKYDFATANYAPWHTHYQQEHYEEIDTTMDTVYHTNLPIYWDLTTQLQQAKSSKEKQMRLDSIAFGVEKGISIPIHGPAEDFAIFLIVQMRGENCLAEWQSLQYELFVVGYYYYSYLQPLLLKNNSTVVKHQLNAREMQCLKLLAKQYSVASIAKNLHITERTVNYHIQRLNKKLGTKNKHQSVTKALQLGLI